MPDPKKKPKAELVVPSGVVVTTVTTITETDALAEVNALRVRRGLRPFIRDDGLTIAAHAAATFRASARLFGHTHNDFQFLPTGVSASSTGCAAYHPSYGWMSCCVNDNYTYAGAAFAMGDDGRRFMHIFVR
jgi:hypothetical protein